MHYVSICWGKSAHVSASVTISIRLTFSICRFKHKAGRLSITLRRCLRMTCVADGADKLTVKAKRSDNGQLEWQQQCYCLIGRKGEPGVLLWFWTNEARMSSRQQIMTAGNSLVCVYSAIQNS